MFRFRIVSNEYYSIFLNGELDEEIYIEKQSSFETTEKQQSMQAEVSRIWSR